MALRLLKFLYRETKGSKIRIVSTSLVSGLSRGALLATFNGAAAAGIAGNPSSGSLLAGFALALIAYLVSTYDAMRHGTGMVETMIARLRLRLCTKLLCSPLRFLEKQGTGEIFTQLGQDIGHLSGASLTVLSAFQAGVLVCFSLCYLAWLSPLSFVAAAVTILAGAAIYYGQNHDARRSLEKARTLQDDFFNRINDLLFGFKELKLSSARRTGLLAHLNAIAGNYRSLILAAETKFAVIFLTSQTFTFLLVAVLVFILPMFVVSERALVFQFLATILFMVGPVETAVGAIPTVARARIALANIERLEAHLDEDLAAAGEDAVEPLSFRTIAFDSVRFYFGGSTRHEEFDVGPIDFELKRGEIVFIVGGNGAGKTTFLKLLTGLYEPTAGAVRIDGHAIPLGEGQPYREMFAVVFSDFHIFHRLYGLDPLDPAAVEALFAELGIADKTRVEDGELTTINLSAGQRKRLAYAISRLADRQIYVFDEFAADQDPQFRRYFYGELLPRLRDAGKTVVAVTHDDRWFATADRVIKMDYGQIVEVSRGERPSPRVVGSSQG